MDAAAETDHYAILGLPSGEEGAKLSQNEIKKAYRAKALTAHPDKNPNDPHAHATFQKIKSSYEILKDATARAAFDALLAAKLDRVRRDARLDSKRRRMMADLNERERAAEAPPVDPADVARRQEEAAAKKFQEEVARIRKMHGKKMEDGIKKREEGGDSAFGAKAEAGDGLDKERILKVSWEREGEDYSVARLKEMFGRFGEVEDVVIRGKGSKKRMSALIVMKSKEAAVSATQSLCGNLSNPVLVLPLYPNAAGSSPLPAKCAEPEPPNLSNLVGAGYQAYEDSILKKLQKAAEKQKS